MIFLLLSILFSAGILVVFKLFEKYQVNTFVAIVINYFVAFLVGASLFGSQWHPISLEENSWMPYALLIGILFISLFLLMGKSAQQNGIGITSVVVKMSLAIPVVFAIYLYQESINTLKIIGVIAAIVVVLLITYQKKTTEKSKKSAIKILFLIILFIGSGLLDTLINYVEKTQLSLLTPALFSAISFGIAGLLGAVVLVFQLQKGLKIKRIDLFGGIFLGIPNYFSIYFLIMAIRHPLDDSITYALNNVGIVLLSFTLGLLFFQEKITKLKLVGVVIAIFAIISLSFS